jgi:hypothetical protein
MRTYFLLLIIAVAPSAFALEVPKFSTGGFTIELQGGAGVPHLDEAQINSSVPFGGSYYTGQVKVGAALGLALAYNILGHASVGLDFTGTGWNPFSPDRGGAGFLVGTIAWHPLQLVYAILKEERPFGLDASTYVGFGYGISGISGSGGGPALGMDGFVVQWGMKLEYFFSRLFGLGFFAKCNFLEWPNFYYDWDAAHSGGMGAVGLKPPVGTWWALGGSLILRIGE